VPTCRGTSAPWYRAGGTPPLTSSAWETTCGGSLRTAARERSAATAEEIASTGSLMTSGAYGDVLCSLSQDLHRVGDNGFRLAQALSLLADVMRETPGDLCGLAQAG
jgi:hypothetical protein